MPRLQVALTSTDESRRRVFAADAKSDDDRIGAPSEQFEVEDFEIDLDKTSWGRFKLPTCRRFIAYSGPGLSTILGSTDAGCLILACAAGKQMGYALIPMQLMLSLVQLVMLFYASRLGTASGMGFAECVQRFYGKRVALGVSFLLLISCFAEMIQEFSGLASVSEVLKLHPAVGVLSGAVVFLSTALLGGSSIQKVVVTMGLSLALFVPLMFYTNPRGDYIAKGWDRIHFENHTFLSLVAAQAGGMVIPWMVFFQQSNVARGRYEALHLGSLHMDVVIGTLFTMIVVTSATAFVAGTLWKEHGDTSQPLQSVTEISDAVLPVVGTAGKILFCIGFTGAALVGGVCLSTTAAMLFNEMIFSAGPSEAMERHVPTSRLTPTSAKVYTLFVVAAGSFVLTGVKLVQVTVYMALINAIISAFILCILFAMGWRILTNETWCDKGWTFTVGFSCTIYVGFAITGVVMFLLSRN